MGIRFDESKKVFQLETKNTQYQIKIDEIGLVLHTYYGPKIGDMDMSYQFVETDRGFSGNLYELRHARSRSMDTMPQEYPGAGMGDYRVSCIELSGPDGSRSADFRYKSHKITKGKYTLPGMPSVREYDDAPDTLELCMADELTGVELTLLYSTFEAKDVLTRTARITNHGNGAVDLEKAFSVCMDFVNRQFDLIHFHGRHCMERQMERVRLTHDIHTIGSRRGMSSHHHNPFVILCDPQTTENQGLCYGCMLVYSGNHKTEIEMEQAGNVRLVMGLHDENFRWRLNAGETFYAPEVILSCSENGLNALSGNYHRIIRENVCDRKYLNMRRPVLINNWEATYFDFNAEKILALARQARDVGVEMFVLDDGWFGKRNDDNAGLGDWYVNEEKLQGGLGALSGEINKMGMKFGLWFEPEMVNEDSDLYRKHPEWALKDPARKPVMARNQMVLDMGNPEVQEYLYDSISKVLDHASISYVKWDFNRSAANVYSNALPPERQGEASHRFVLGTYALLERLTAKYPDVMIEGCAGGGGRFDAGMLYYSPQIWCSDNTDPIARLAIQSGTSYGYPVSTMGSHVSASPNHQTGRTTTLHTRGVVAMSGTFGYELDLNQITDEEKEEMKRQIETFKKYYWLIQKGTYYRLKDDRRDPFYEAWEFVSEDQSKALLNVVLTDVHANSEIPWVRLHGLAADRHYRLEGTDEVYLGAALMQGGCGVKVYAGDYPAVQLHYVEVR